MSTSALVRPHRVLGAAPLVAVVIGSGIAAQQLSPDHVAQQLLENSTAWIAPGSAVTFIDTQLVGLAVGVAVTLGRYPDISATADDVVIPHPTRSMPRSTS